MEETTTPARQAPVSERPAEVSAIFEALGELYALIDTYSERKDKRGRVLQQPPIADGDRAHTLRVYTRAVRCTVALWARAYGVKPPATLVQMPGVPVVDDAGAGELLCSECKVAPADPLFAKIGGAHVRGTVQCGTWLPAPLVLQLKGAEHVREAFASLFRRDP